MAVKSGYHNISPHSLRHTFATQQLQHGMNIRTLQYYMVHKSLTQTEKYLHFVQQNEQNIINNF